MFLSESAEEDDEEDLINVFALVAFFIVSSGFVDDMDDDAVVAESGRK